MADAFDNGEFLLPSQFLTEEDILNDFDISTPTTGSTDGFNSGLGSPADSVTETESDEEDFVAGLTRRLSRSSLTRRRITVNPRERGRSGSPKSTLQQGNSGSASSRGSPTGPVSSPPAHGGTSKFTDSDPLNLLEAAAGEVAKLSMRQQGTGFFDNSRGFLASQREQTGPVSPPNSRNPNFPAPSYPNQSHQQLQAFQFQQFWNREMMKQQNKNGADFFAGGRPNLVRNRPLGLPPAAWPTLQHAANLNGNVFASPAGMKRESVGTGVFLPRMPSSTASHLRKNSIKIDSSKRSHGHNSRGVQAPRRNSDNARSEGVANLEIQLPSEWTY